MQCWPAAIAQHDARSTSTAQTVGFRKLQNPTSRCEQMVCCSCGSAWHPSVMDCVKLAWSALGVTVGLEARIYLST